MEKKSWYNRVNLFGRFSGKSDEKSMSAKIEKVVEDFRERSDYDAKFLDSEASGGNQAGASEIAGIDQQIDISALQRVYASETWVYNAVTAIAETIGGLPIKLEKATKVKRKVTNEITGMEETVEQTVWNDASGEKLFDRFQYPNRYTTKTEFFMMLIIDLMTAGEYYVYLEPREGIDLTSIQNDPTDDKPNSPFGRLRSTLAGSEPPIKSMYRIPPAMMRPVPSADRRCIEGYEMNSDGKEYVFNFAEIVHVKLPNPMDPFRGLSPLIAAFKPVILDRFTTEHMIRFYKSGARLGGVIETQKSLNKEQLSRFQRSYENNFTGRQNHHRTLILPPGMKYNQIEQNPAETSLLDFCKYNREAILSTYKVPPIKVGILDNANYANARAQLQTFFNDCIKPKLSFVEDGFNLKSAMLPDNRTFRFKFDLQDVDELKEDLKVKAETGKLMLEAGLSVDEVRHDLWKKGKVDKGDKIPVIEKLEKPAQAFPIAGLSAEPGQHKEAEVTPPTDIKPTGGSFSDRVRELVGQMVQAGVPMDIAIPKAIEQARLEGFIDEPASPAPTAPKSNACTVCGKQPCECPGKDAKKPTLAEFISDSLSSLKGDELVDAAFIEQLQELYNLQYAEPVVSKETEVATTETDLHPDTVATQEAVTLSEFGYTKDKFIEHWKTFVTASDPLIDKRLIAVKKFFKEFERVLMNRFGANIKSYGVMKARDSEDIDEILKLEGYEGVMKSYIEEIDRALEEAYKFGYQDTLANFKFGPPNEQAIKFLNEYGAKEVKYITDTTRDQMREVLTDAFKRGVAVGEVSKALREKFVEIEQGRAVTIARTETLSAVSAGRAEKRIDFQEQFPDQKLMKIWVSAQDDRVRDSHQQLEGEVVDADAKFSNGLAYPREAGGPPEEVINCRCDEITFVPEDRAIIEETLNSGNSNPGNAEE